MKLAFPSVSLHRTRYPIHPSLSERIAYLEQWDKEKEAKEAGKEQNAQQQQQPATLS